MVSGTNKFGPKTNKLVPKMAHKSRKFPTKINKNGPQTKQKWSEYIQKMVRSINLRLVIYLGKYISEKCTSEKVNKIDNKT